MRTFNVIPLARDLVSHEVISEGSTPHTNHIVRFTYPDGIREFDGKNWTAKPFDSSAKITHIVTPG